jgi:prepilin-type N-terminal cleavage/methylation domain-containing protein
MKKIILAEGLALVRGIFDKLVGQKGELNGKDVATSMRKTILAEGLALVRGKNNTFTCKSAFTMIELIFVIIIIAVIASVGMAFIPNTTAINDANFLIQKIKETQKNALSYDTQDFNTTRSPWADLPFNSTEYNLTCTSLNPAVLNTLEQNSSRPYTIESNVVVIGATNTLCFDFLGRPYSYQDGSNRLLFVRLDINVSQSDNSQLLSVYPISGYVKIQ